MSELNMNMALQRMPGHESARHIRVAFVNHTAQLGGAEIALRNLLQHLDPERIDAQLILCADGPLIDQVEKNTSVHLVSLPSHIREARKASIGWKTLSKPGDVIETIAYIVRLSRYLRTMQVQLIHTNSMKAHLLGGIAGKLANVPVIWHVRDRIAADYLPSGAVRLVKILSRFIPSFVIANSRATLATLMGDPSHAGNKSRRAVCRVIHDGCDVPATQSWPESTQPATIGLVGRISPWKGQHIFIRAAAMLKDDFPDVRFLIVGAPLFSESEYELEVRHLARELRLEQAIEFTGFVHDVQGVIQKLHILVHASTIGEPFGQVVIEGMAAGRPVIATNGGGIPEIVVDHITGLLVPMNDARALADAMRTLLLDMDTARAMGALGRQRVKDFFTMKRTAEAVEKVYADVVRHDLQPATQRDSCPQIRTS
jgi:glycosyltransferase involved in cell wall biosynthesis